MSITREHLIARYGGNAPRYTSYPTANHFSAMDDGPLRAALAGGGPVFALYAHVPFCQKLCWYCGCNTVIRRDRALGDALVDDLLVELARIARHLPDGAALGQLAMGGGTPNFLRPDALERWFDGLDALLPSTADCERAIELDPRTVDDAQLDLLTGRGFQRFSLGVQSLDPAVQAAVNRPLDPARVASIAERLRAGGARTLNLDLMVGLPHQRPGDDDPTLAHVLAIRPERLAVFQYAHVPAMRPAQRLLERAGLPEALARDALFREVGARLRDAGYVRIGLDHFALPDDPLARARAEGTLGRDFQGYTTHAALDLLAVGPSAIGRIGGLFTQNERDLAAWRRSLRSGSLPVARGIVQTPEDRVAGALIRDLMCQGRVRWAGLDPDAVASARDRIAEAAADGLVRIRPDGFDVTEVGLDFVRAIAAWFDPRLDRSRHAAVA